MPSGREGALSVLSTSVWQRGRCKEDATHLEPVYDSSRCVLVGWEWCECEGRFRIGVRRQYGYRGTESDVLNRVKGRYGVYVVNTTWAGESVVVVLRKASSGSEVLGERF